MFIFYSVLHATRSTFVLMLRLDHIPVAFCHLAKLHSKLTIKNSVMKWPLPMIEMFSFLDKQV